MKRYSGDGHQADDMCTGTRVLVVGLGVTGLSCVQYLMAKGHVVEVVDSRKTPPCLEQVRKSFPTVPVALGNFSDEVFARAESIIVSPGVSLQETALRDAQSRGIPVRGDIELFFREVQAPVVAITGSNGKSTVTALVSEMAKLAGKKALVGGNFGTPALDLLAEDVPDFYVLELSSFQLEASSELRTAVSVVLNISEDHMDRYENLEAYAAAKGRVFSHANVQLVNVDDPLVVSLAGAGRKKITFGLNELMDPDYVSKSIKGQHWLICKGEALMPVAELGLPGRHNASNALAALAIGDLLGLSRVAMVRCLREWNGLPHRMQLVLDQDNIHWYNDSKGTNVGATIAAITGVNRPLVLIAGGDAKGADLTPLQDVVKGKVRSAIVYGRDASRISEVLQGMVDIVSVETLQEAVAKAASVVRPGEAVLLSPACASLDMFRDYRERGDLFISEVKKLSR